MGELFPTGTYETWSDCTLYLPYALQAIAWKEVDGYKNRVLLILQRVGRYYWEQGRSDEAERLDVEVLELRKEVLGVKHPDTITAMANLALMNQQSTSTDREARLEGTASTSSVNVNPTEETTLKKSRVERWTRKLTRFRKPKNS